jgi:hypothetical protein
MATIIDLDNDRFIAGDPDTTLHDNNHWCYGCGGDGLDYDYNDELTICSGCSGIGQVECDDTGCTLHGIG